MSFTRLTAAAAILALTSAAHAQDLMLFPPETFGQVVAPRNESLLGDVQLEAQVGAYNNEFISNYGANSVFARTGRSVGMLQILTNAGHAPCTGFLVEGNKIVTNHHCVPGILKHPQMKAQGANSIAAVQFHVGFVRDGLDEGVKTFHVNPVPLETSEALDYTVLQVLGDANTEFGALELSAAVPQDRDPFWVIGHPMGEAQRISREKCRADSPAVAKQRLRHTCDTLPGNSGSPVIDAGSQKVIGLHHAGSRAGRVNFAVPMAEILAQSKVLKASAGGGSVADLSALQAELARLRAEREKERAQAELERKRLADEAKRVALEKTRGEQLALARAEAERFAFEKAEAERKKLADQLAALQAEPNRSVTTITKPVASPRGQVGPDTEPALPLTRPLPAGATPVALADSAGFPGHYWEKIVKVFSGHEGFVDGVGFSPSGKQIVTASDDKTARIWDVASGRLLTTLSGHSDWVRSANFSPDGAKVVTASWDRTASIWDAATGEMLITFSGHKDAVQRAEFSPDGMRIVTASWDNTARIWDVHTGQVIFSLADHDDWVLSAKFSPDGKRIVTTSKDGSVKIWDATNGRKMKSIDGREDAVWSASFSSDGQRIAFARDDGAVYILDATSGRTRGRLRAEAGKTNAHSPSFSPDGKRVVVVRAGRPEVWDETLQKRIATLSGGSGNVLSASFSPNGAYILTGSDDKKARIWGGY